MIVLFTSFGNSDILVREMTKDNFQIEMRDNKQPFSVASLKNYEDAEMVYDYFVKECAKEV